MNAPRLTSLLLLALLVLPAGRGAYASQAPEDQSAGAGVLFDGVEKRTGTAKAPGAAASDKARLLAELKTRVTVNDRGSQAEGKALNSILSRVLDSPTGRELAAKFIEEDARAVVAFEEIPNTQVHEINGKKTFFTSGGHVHTTSNPLQVHLNSAYLEAKQNETPDTMAHELFGHALERKRAERYGVADVYVYNQNDEANAGLAGWTVSAELGNKIEDGWAWIYMANPDDYHKRLKSNHAYYAGTLSAEEMKDPLPVYQERLKQTEELLLRQSGRKGYLELWPKMIDHLVTAHKKIEAAFRTLTEEIRAAIANIPGEIDSLNKMKQRLKRLIATDSNPEGKAWLASFQKKSNNTYFAEMEKVIAERKKALAGLMLAKTEDSRQPPPIAGQYTFDEFFKMMAEDRNSCRWEP